MAHVSNVANKVHHFSVVDLPSIARKPKPLGSVWLGSGTKDSRFRLRCEKTGRREVGVVVRVSASASVSTAEKPLKAPEIVLQPIKEISGTVKLPGSKSLSNRILLLAALSEGTTVVDNLLSSDDIHYMLGALQTLGLHVEEDKENKRAVVTGCGGQFPVGKDSNEEIQLFLGNAGTAMRPLTAAVTVAGGNSRYVLDGVPRMRERPIGDLVAGLKQLGAEADCFLGTDCPPVRVNAKGGLPGGKVDVLEEQMKQIPVVLQKISALESAIGELRLEVQGLMDQIKSMCLHPNMHAFRSSLIDEAISQAHQICANAPDLAVSKLFPSVSDLDMVHKQLQDCRFEVKSEFRGLPMKIDEPLLQPHTNSSKVSSILHIGESCGDNRPTPTPSPEPPDLVVLRVDSSNVALARPPWPPPRSRSSLMLAFLLRVHGVFVDQDLACFGKVGHEVGHLGSSIAMTGATHFMLLGTKIRILGWIIRED